MTVRPNEGIQQVQVKSVMAVLAAMKHANPRLRFDLKFGFEKPEPVSDVDERIEGRRGVDVHMPERPICPAVLGAGNQLADLG